MSNNSHQLHVTIGNIFKKALPEGYKLIKDEAGGGRQRIPLFTSKEKSRETWYCDVDLLILKDDKIKIIVEIEESNLGPTQVCGKFLTSALTRYYIHKKNDDKLIEMNDSVTFIQIMDTEKLNIQGTKKFKQWENIEKSINAILPVKGRKIKKYGLFHGSVSDFKDKEYAQELMDFIKNACT